MAYDKVIDSAQLDANLTAVADAIRSKTGKTDKLTLEQMPGEIEGIQSGGGEYYTANGGMIYVPHMVIEQSPNSTIQSSTANGSNWYREADKLITYRTNILTGGDNMFRACVNMTDFVMTAGGAIDNNGWCLNLCTGLKNVQFGSVGNPIESFKNPDYFRGCTQSYLVITVYVDKNTIADAQAICPGIPGYATNATIIYRNSTTGEVITE